MIDAELTESSAISQMCHFKPFPIVGFVNIRLHRGLVMVDIPLPRVLVVLAKCTGLVALSTL